ncbi:hypothetical protein A2996_00470 [Candidatus Campbellbacteria bacterium RIFCSPLOWO2_01_FULL_34_15]|uniref:Uncharacterized protein n=2 Tax=Candidatus Campbelliibacteriota TaxID=1752727 RepID=A0A1F5ELN3_9BACT|nr:MAG: hypothetical protein A2996_00470 [Candidatus Campbellbacteria bacterium RIFCSPLOWO2_01_FULL_34_15]OGD68732.1 MAG: hypothetical protein A2811_01910 [Candidatus Campbellbacteria bacterium RIFCSPHIGHO2_01_FULL_34_10]
MKIKNLSFIEFLILVSVLVFSILAEIGYFKSIHLDLESVFWLFSVMFLFIAFAISKVVTLSFKALSGPEQIEGDNFSVKNRSVNISWQTLLISGVIFFLLAFFDVLKIFEFSGEHDSYIFYFPAVILLGSGVKKFLYLRKNKNK